MSQIIRIVPCISNNDKGLAKLIVHVYCIPLSTSINERITSFRPSQHLLQRKQTSFLKSVKFRVQTIRSFHTDRPFCPFWLISSLQCQQFSGLSVHSKQIKILSYMAHISKNGLHRQKSRIQNFAKIPKSRKSGK